MLPYPSGDLHVGHWYAMVPSDTAARYKRMRGYNVFFPIGFDAFGLPAENAAIKHGLHPRDWTCKNIESMCNQLRQMGAMWAWDREVVTCEPDYYKWSQWFFLRMLEADLAYRDFSTVDWCPSCNTTLAREQVWGDDRHCERCDTPVIRKDLEQWKFRITNYADELLDALDGLDWPDPVCIMQTNWIGRSEGAQVTFHTEAGDPLEVFTTRPDTLWGATFIALAPEHPLVSKVTVVDRKSAVDAYVAQVERNKAGRRRDAEQACTGEFTGSYAINPANEERIPIWVADYVIMEYGTGAIMAVPAHNERDLAFARRFGLEVRRVFAGSGGNSEHDKDVVSSKIEEQMINSGCFDGTPSTESVPKVIAWLEETGRGKAHVNYRLRDWLISRQRMWGTPIPIVYCDKCGTVPVRYEDLPVALPEETSIPATGENALLYTPSFLDTICPRCQGAAKRETDTMDTFVCSSWYQYAYADPYHKSGERLTRDDKPWNSEIGRYWLPVDQYTGGVEHATMHLLYTRFFTKVLRDLGIVDVDEPMLRLFNQGTILGPDGQRMSKSRGNVVDPSPVVAQYGADVVRGYLMFVGPWTQGGPWNSQRIEGIRRFLQRFWTIATFQEGPKGTEDNTTGLEQKLHATIQKVTEDLDQFRFNTAIAALMELNNELMKALPISQGSKLWNQAIDTMCLLMAPFFPHLSEEVWSRRGHEKSVHLQSWPKYNAAAFKKNRIEMVVQVNGKLCTTMEVNAGLASSQVQEKAMSLPNVKTRLGVNAIQRVIVVPDKLVNLVV